MVTTPVRNCVRPAGGVTKLIHIVYYLEGQISLGMCVNVRERGFATLA